MQGVSNAYDIVRDRDRYDAGAAEAGTIFPSLDTYEANGDQIVGYYNYGIANPPLTWSPTLVVLRERYIFPPPDPTGPSTIPPYLDEQPPGAAERTRRSTRPRWPRGWPTHN